MEMDTDTQMNLIRIIQNSSFLEEENSEVNTSKKSISNRHNENEFASNSYYNNIIIYMRMKIVIKSMSKKTKSGLEVLIRLMPSSTEEHIKSNL
jgi:hypothetical protein